MSLILNGSAEREAIVLILNHEPAQAMLLSILEPEDFSLSLYRDVFIAARRLLRDGRQIDHVSVFGEIKGKCSIADLPYEFRAVLEIDDCQVKRVDHVPSVIEEIQSNRRARQLIEAIDRAHAEIVDTSPANVISPDEMLASLEEKLASIRYVGSSECADTDELMALHNVDICRDPETIEREYVRARQWSDFSRTFPFERKSLAGIAARPGGGKSSFMLHLLAQLAKSGYHGCFFSIEMDRAPVFNRLLACVSGIPKWKFRHGEADSEERGYAFGELAKITPHFQIRFQGKIRLAQIAADLYRWKARHPLDFFIVDYLQIIDDSEFTFKKRYEAIGQIARGLRELARQLDSAAIVGIQVGRDAEKSAGARHIRLSDFRESGNIENDLDAAVGLNLVDCTEAIDNVEAEILKNREGVKGRIIRMVHRKDFNQWGETIEFPMVDSRIQS